MPDLIMYTFEGSSLFTGMLIKEIFLNNFPLKGLAQYSGNQNILLVLIIHMEITYFIIMINNIMLKRTAVLQAKE